MKIHVECLIWPVCGGRTGVGSGRSAGGVRETQEEKLVGGSSNIARWKAREIGRNYRTMLFKIKKD